MADNKVNFLRGTSAEYESKTKDNDTFYYITDTKKLYLGETEITGIEIDDTTTTAIDKTWSAKKISDSIPTTLPANGGNADTLDGKYASEFAQMRGDIADCNNAVAFGTYNIVPETKNAPTANYYHLVVEPAANGAWIKQTAVLSNADASLINSFTRININGTWSAWTNIADGGNADTVDGNHADTFLQYLGVWTSGSVLTKALGLNVSGFVYCSDAVIDLPESNKYFVVDIRNSDGSIQLTATRFNNGATYTNRYNNGLKAWYGWKNVADGGNAATVNGHTVESDVPANAKFTDTTYSLATTSADGLMSANDKLKLNYTNIAYATCDTAADTSAKVATISGNSKWSLAVGSIVTVKFSATNTASNCTLNVNGTGAKQIWYHDSVHTGNSSNVCGIANAFITFMYDGTYWVWIGHSNDNYPSYASETAAGIVSTGTQHFAGYKIFPTKIAIKTTGTVGTQPTSDINSVVYFTNPEVNAQFGEVKNCIRGTSATTNGEVFTLMSAYSNDRTGSNTIKVVATNNNSGNYISIGDPTVTSSFSCLRKLSSGTTEATTTNCPSGSWYGKHS